MAITPWLFGAMSEGSLVRTPFVGNWQESRINQEDDDIHAHFELQEEENTQSHR